MEKFCDKCYFGLRTAYKDSWYCGKDLKSFWVDDNGVCPDFIDK